MSDAIKLGVNGASGRMGRRIVACGHNTPGMEVTLALDSPKSPLLGQDAGELAGIGSIGVPLTSAGDFFDAVDVMIDFSVPDACVKIAEVCGERKIPLVVATTGLDEAQRETVLAASQTTAMIIAANTSTAVNLAMKLVGDAAKALKGLPEGVDVEIVERHHRFKEDAPSGTALKFGEIVADELGQDEHVHGRHGRPGKRKQTEIGYHALRTGDNVGEHSIVFGMMGETLEVYVRGHTRDSYAFGAVNAAQYLVKQGPGLYSMADVLGF
ncbi:4-hydroxy-tetrahydrodipicolinate reductase [Rubinisphaera sp. JC750]|uniref:4-hydroxy-tetrahydrodipicolinate reductase n=1 Tax=Rubinisphaera sp. JC750 TaxID=2898658 RepID=UPI001F02AF99|nr:4-hydroxy-tetrahydrodipicolinate reductase [Rubinisphaera sp. JC750]